MAEHPGRFEGLREQQPQGVDPLRSQLNALADSKGLPADSPFRSITQQQIDFADLVGRIRHLVELTPL